MNAIFTLLTRNYSHLQFHCCGLNGPEFWFQNKLFQSGPIALPQSCCKKSLGEPCNSDYAYSKGCMTDYNDVENCLKHVRSLLLGFCIFSVSS